MQAVDLLRQWLIDLSAPHVSAKYAGDFPEMQPRDPQMYLSVEYSLLPFTGCLRRTLGQVPGDCDAGVEN